MDVVDAVAAVCIGSAEHIESRASGDHVLQLIQSVIAGIDSPYFLVSAEDVVHEGENECETSLRLIDEWAAYVVDRARCPVARQLVVAIRQGGDIAEHRRVEPTQHHVLELPCGTVDVNRALVDADRRIYVDEAVKPLSEI